MFQETEYECCFCSKIKGQHAVKITTSYNSGGERIDIYQACDECYDRLKEKSITTTTCCGEYLTKWDDMCPCTFKMITGSLSMEKKIGTFDHRRAVEIFPIWESPSSKLANLNHKLEQLNIDSKTYKEPSHVTSSTSDYSLVSDKEEKLKGDFERAFSDSTKHDVSSYNSKERSRKIEIEEAIIKNKSPQEIQEEMDERECSVCKKILKKQERVIIRGKIYCQFDGTQCCDCHWPLDNHREDCKLGCNKCYTFSSYYGGYDRSECYNGDCENFFGTKKQISNQRKISNLEKENNNLSRKNTKLSSELSDLANELEKLKANLVQKQNKATQTEHIEIPPKK